MNKVYLGDGLYAHYDGFHIWLTTLEGNEVALEDHVVNAFLKYVEQIFNVDIKVTPKTPRGPAE